MLNTRIIINLLLSTAIIGIAFSYSSIFQFSMIDLLLFGSFTFCIVWIPGFLLLSFLLPGMYSKKELFIISNALGLVALCYFSWLFNVKFDLPYFSYFFLLLTFFALVLPFMILRYIRMRPDTTKFPDFAKISLFFNSLIRSSELTVFSGFVILAFLLSMPIQINGTLSGNEYNFYSTTGNEGLWHIGNIAYMKKDLHLGDIHQNGVEFVYHTFVYIFCAHVSTLCNIEISDIYFKFLPFYQFLFLSYSIYVAASMMFKSRFAGIASALCFFMLDDLGIVEFLSIRSGIEWITYLFMGPKITNVFISTPSMNTGLIVFFSILLFIRKSMCRHQIRGWFTILLTGFLVGTLVGIKANVFFIASLGLIALTAIDFFKNRSTYFLRIGIVGLVVALPFLADISSGSGTAMIFNPLWFALNSKLGLLFADNMSDPESVVFFVILGTIYLAIELGPRLLAFRYILYDWKNTEPSLLYLWICSILGIGLSLLITPDPQPYNIMYFHRFGALCLSFMMGRLFMGCLHNGRASFFGLLLVSLPYMGQSTYNYFRPRSHGNIQIAKSKAEALKSLRNERSDGFKRIISNVYSFEDPLLNEKYWAYTAFMGQVVLSEGAAYSSLPMSDPALFKEIRQDIDLFYRTTDADSAEHVLRKWNIDFIIVDHEFKKKINFKTDRMESVVKNSYIEILRYTK